jgi:hypothetical protein
MVIHMRPAIPAALPRAGVTADHNRLLRWFSAAFTALTAAMGVLAVSILAVLLGIIRTQPAVFPARENMFVDSITSAL